MVDDFGGEPVEEWNYDRTRAEARERWERDDYDEDGGGAFQRMWDAYALAYEERETYIDALISTWEYFAKTSLGGKARRAEEFDHYTIPELPPVPTENVAEAIIWWGEQYGVDGYGLRERHGDEWLLRFIENVAFESSRRDAEKTNAVWEPETTERRIRRWRVAYSETYSGVRIARKS